MVGNSQRLQLWVSTAAISLALSSCSDMSPGCGSDKVIDEVTRVLKTQATNVDDIDIERVHTLRTNFATGEVLCSAAVVTTNGSATPARISVGYNVYYDAQRRIAVSVYGATE